MTAPVQTGDVLGGKFRVERVLGTGGMGVIVAAHHLQLDQLVALKFLLPEAAKDSEVVTRFAREARAAAKIQSEHVARVLDVGTLDTGAPYMVMEYLEGEDLDDILEHVGTLPVTEAVGYVLQACEAVAEAHALGIVHRDLKPANLFLADRADGTRSIKVLDFGISKLLPEGAQAADASLTRTSTVMGSPMYMSPEQLRSARDIDVRADIWSLGIILYEMLCGDGPFSTGTVAEVCAAILKDPAKPPREIRDDVPEGVQTVVMRCLEKEAAKRYANIAELATELLFFGPPGSERSMERISRVLRKGATLRGTDSKKHGRPDVRKEEPAATRATGKGVPLELAQTKASGPVDVPAELAATKLEPATARVPELSATASAATMSSLREEPQGEKKRPKAAIVALFAIVAIVAGGSIYAVSKNSSSQGTEATETPRPTPPTADPTPIPVPTATTEASTVEPPVPTASAFVPPSAAPVPSAPAVAPRPAIPRPRPAATGAPSSAASSSPSATPSSTAAATTAPATTAAPTASVKATAAPSSGASKASGSATSAATSSTAKPK